MKLYDLGAFALVAMLFGFIVSTADHCAKDGELDSPEAKACYEEIIDNRKPPKFND